MTYHEFKKQLCHSLTELETAKETKIGILEKGMVYEDVVARRVIQAANLSDQGREENVLKEDLLYVIWDKEQYDSMLYWPVRTFYERFKTEGWQGVLPEVAMAIGCGNGRQGELPSESDTYVQHRANLILRPLSLERRREELANCIYWEFGDVALVLYLLVHEDAGNMISLKLEREITEKWGKRDAVLLTGALLNSAKRMPPRLFLSREEMKYCDERGGVFMPGEEGISTRIDLRDASQGNRGYHLTTTRRVNGAVALFYPGVKERLSELLGGDYFVAFFSIHEAVIYPVRRKILSEVKAELRHENALSDNRSYLTGRVYRYGKIRGELLET